MEFCTICDPGHTLLFTRHAFLSTSNFADLLLHQSEWVNVRILGNARVMEDFGSFYIHFVYGPGTLYDLLGCHNHVRLLLLLECVRLSKSDLAPCSQVKRN